MLALRCEFDWRFSRLKFRWGSGSRNQLLELAAMLTNRWNPKVPLSERALESMGFSKRRLLHMSISGKYRKESSISQLRTLVILGGASLALRVIALGAFYYSSPYFATDPVVERLANKPLSAAASDGEIRRYRRISIRRWTKSFLAVKAINPRRYVDSCSNARPACSAVEKHPPSRRPTSRSGRSNRR